MVSSKGVQKLQSPAHEVSGSIYKIEQHKAANRNISQNF